MLAFQPMPLGRKPVPFDYPAYLFELKYDAFRAPASLNTGAVLSIPATVIRSHRSQILLQESGMLCVLSASLRDTREIP